MTCFARISLAFPAGTALRCAAALSAATLLAASSAQAAAVFNLRANLTNGYYAAGTLTIDTATGLVTGEEATLFKDSVAVSTFGAPSDQGGFAPGGGAPSYLFNSAGTGGYVFVGAAATPSLVGYGGGELCSLTSAVKCLYSDVFVGGADVADVSMGVLAPVTDVVKTFNLLGTFANGYNVVGTVTIDTTIGYVLDEEGMLFSKGVLVDSFVLPGGTSTFAPSGLNPSLIIQSLGLDDVLLNLSIPGVSLVGYEGGNLCATTTGLDCAFSDIFLTASGLSESDATTASLNLATRALPEPSSLPLVSLSLSLLVAGMTWRRGGQVSWS